MYRTTGKDAEMDESLMTSPSDGDDLVRVEDPKRSRARERGTFPREEWETHASVK